MQQSGPIGGLAYLEIGVHEGSTLAEVNCGRKVGVDPSFSPEREAVQAKVGDHVTLHEMTSNSYFEVSQETFDFIYIDGLHHWEQVYSDFVCSLARLRPGGLILLDDTLPIDWFSMRRNKAFSIQSRRFLKPKARHRHAWHGDVFKVVPLVASFHRDLEWATFDRGNGQTLFWRRLEWADEHSSSTGSPVTTSERKPLRRIGNEEYFWFLKNRALFQIVSEQGFRLSRRAS